MASPQWTILTSVQSTIQGIAGFSGITVAIREKPFCSTDHGDTLPLVVISPGKESVNGYHMPNGVWIDWPILVSIFQEKSGSVEDATAMQWRVTRRWELFQALAVSTLSGLTNLLGFDYNASPLVDGVVLAGHIKVSHQEFTYRSNELRGGAG